MSTIEIIAAFLGVANVALLTGGASGITRSDWRWLLLYGWVFYGARLYSDAALQGFFFVVQIYGWWNWHRARDAKGLARIEILSGRGRLAWLAVIAAATVAEGWYLARFTPDAAPWMDANTTAMSVVAQYLLSVRKVENWVLWIVTDVVQIGLYFWKGPYPTTALYAVFLVLSVFGLREWHRQVGSAA